MGEKDNQGNHNKQYDKDNLPPVIGTFTGHDGNEINIRYHGTWADLCRNCVKSLPQNRPAFQPGDNL